MKVKKLKYTSVENIRSTPKIKLLDHDNYAALRSQKLTVYVNSRIHIIDKDRISYLKAEGNYCTVVLEANNKILVSKTLKYLSSSLDRFPFVRVHNAYLVNLRKVTAVNKQGEMTLVLYNGDKVPVSRSNRSNVLRKLMG